MKFQINSSFFQFMNTLATFIGLNVLFLFLCLPIVTIGPAITALYATTMQEARQEYSSVFSTFFKAFKKNFLQSTCAFFLHLSLILIFLFNAFFWGNQGSVLGILLLLVMTLAILITIISFSYTFPLIARFQNSLIQTLKNSVLIPLLHQKQTFCIIGIQLFAIIICLVIPQAKIFMIFLGFSFFAYCNSFFFIRVFSQYETQQEVQKQWEIRFVNFSH